MSGEDRRPEGFRGWLLPVMVAAAGVGALAWLARRGTLKPVALTPVGWLGLALMLAGLAAVVAGRVKREHPRSLALQLGGVLACGIGAMLVICV